MNIGHDGPVSILATLPAPAPTRIAVRATPDAIRRLRAGHPWLFDGSITSISRPGVAGDVAVVFDDHRRFVAIGLYDPDSPIRVRILHAGAPATIDEAWFDHRIAAAIAMRASLTGDGSSAPQTTAYRLVHGENDALPGLVIDRYGPIAVVKLYSAAWIPHLAVVVPVLRRLLPLRSVVLRLARNVMATAIVREAHLHDGITLIGPEVDGPVEFTEAGLRFEADVVRGNKTGHFLDQRDNRIRVGTLSAGARVLDMFCSTGGFSVHAAAGGARVVHSVDISPWAIAATEHNLGLNSARPEVAACHHESTVGDAFEVFARLARERRSYDIVIVDPPSFAPRADAVERALASYARLAEAAVAVVAPGGLLVQASCSARVSEADFVRAVHVGAGRAGYELDEVARTQHPADHPIGFAEGAYLKAVYARPHRRASSPPESARRPVERRAR